jgi:hypothetical protein
MGELSIAIHASGFQIDAVGPYGIGALLALAALLFVARWTKLL